jgi:hypothetical protein
MRGTQGQQPDSGLPGREYDEHSILSADPGQLLFDPPTFCHGLHVFAQIRFSVVPGEFLKSVACVERSMKIAIREWDHEHLHCVQAQVRGGQAVPYSSIRAKFVEGYAFFRKLKPHPVEPCNLTRI